jgi:hypothetical protein
MLEFTPPPIIYHIIYKFLLSQYHAKNVPPHGAIADNRPGPPHYRGFTIPPDTPQSVGHLCASDQPEAETFNWQHPQQSQETAIHVPGGIRIRNPSKRTAADQPLGLRGHEDGPEHKITDISFRN